MGSQATDEAAAHTKSDAVRQLQGSHGEQIEVDASFRPAEGAALLPGVTVGKLLGTGMAVSQCCNAGAS